MIVCICLDLKLPPSFFVTTSPQTTVLCDATISSQDLHLSVNDEEG